MWWIASPHSLPMFQSPPPSAVGCYQCDLSLQLHVPPSHHLKRLSKYSSPGYVTACSMRNFDLSNLKKKCFLSLLSSMYVTKPRSALGWASGPCLARTGLHHDVARTPCVITVRRITWERPYLNSLSSFQTQQKYRHTHKVPRCSATWHTPMHHDASMQSNR